VYPYITIVERKRKYRRGQLSSLGDVTSIPCEKDDRAVISRN
jgi:hypothetical protein